MFGCLKNIKLKQKIPVPLVAKVEKSFKLFEKFYKPHNEELFKLIGKEYKW